MKEENHDLSFKLISIIKDNATYKVALGFDKGEGKKNPSSGGKKVAEHYHDIGRELFIDNSDSHWSWEESDLEHLKDVICNWISFSEFTIET